MPVLNSLKFAIDDLKSQVDSFCQTEIEKCKLIPHTNEPVKIGLAKGRPVFARVDLKNYVPPLKLIVSLEDGYSYEYKFGNR